MHHIYILKLEENKYYIGKSLKLKKRLRKHRRGFACHWTRINKFKEVITTYETEDLLEEDIQTFRYMAKYGIDNVRGGSFCRTKITEGEKIFLKRIIFSTKNKCFCCGEKGHLSNTCEKAVEYEINRKNIILKKLEISSTEEINIPSVNNSSDKMIHFIYILIILALICKMLF